MTGLRNTNLRINISHKKVNCIAREDAKHAKKCVVLKPGDLCAFASLRGNVFIGQLHC